MTDLFGRIMIHFIESRMSRYMKEHKLMRIVGKRFTIWVTERIDK